MGGEFNGCEKSRSHWGTVGSRAVGGAKSI